MARHDGIPEPTQWNGSDLREWPSVETPDVEERRERDWMDLEIAAREFVTTYGASAMLRCVSRALDDQRELIHR